jgi:predicted dehydrogenase
VSTPSVAVVGVGHMGGLHAQKLKLLDDEGRAHFVGVYDVDAARAAEVAAPLDAPVLDSLEQVVERADAACLAVPTGLHFELAERLLRGGLDLLVEKPMATTREHARALIELAREKKRLLQVGHIERFSRAFREIQPILERPRFIEVHRLGPYTGRATDASVVLDLMIHDLDIVALLAGAEVESCEAVGVPVLSGTCDIANARLRFANGCIANLTASRVSAERLRKLRLFQSNAYISIDFGTNRIQVLRREGEPGDGEPPKISGEQLEFDEADALLAQDRAFVEALRSRETPVVTGEDGYRALDLALRIQDSIPPEETG